MAESRRQEEIRGQIYKAELERRRQENIEASKRKWAEQEANENQKKLEFDNEMKKYDDEAQKILDDLNSSNSDFGQSFNQPSISSGIQPTITDQRLQNGGYTLTEFDGSLNSSVEAFSWGIGKTISTGELDLDLVTGGIGIISNIAKNNEERRAREAAEAERMKKEREQLEMLNRKRRSFFETYTRSKYSRTGGCKLSYFFFLNKEGNAVISFSQIFSIPKNSTNQLPFRIDIEKNYKSQTNKNQVFLKGPFCSSDEAIKQAQLIASVANDNIIAVYDEVSYSYYSRHLTISNDFWGESNKIQKKAEDDFWGTNKEGKKSENELMNTGVKKESDFWGANKQVEKKDKQIDFNEDPWDYSPGNSENINPTTRAKIASMLDESVYKNEISSIGKWFDKELHIAQDKIEYHASDYFLERIIARSRGKTLVQGAATFIQNIAKARETYNTTLSFTNEMEPITFAEDAVGVINSGVGEADLTERLERFWYNAKETSARVIFENTIKLW
jgi:hypothetical protein